MPFGRAKLPLSRSIWLPYHQPAVSSGWKLGLTPVKTRGSAGASPSQRGTHVPKGDTPAFAIGPRGNTPAMPFARAKLPLSRSIWLPYHQPAVSSGWKAPADAREYSRLGRSLALPGKTGGPIAAAGRNEKHAASNSQRVSSAAGPKNRRLSFRQITRLSLWATLAADRHVHTVGPIREGSAIDGPHAETPAAIPRCHCSRR